MVPNKVDKYFPFAPRFRKLYTSQGNVMPCTDDEPLNDFDKPFPDFASDIRVVCLAFTTDGFNPLSPASINHSIGRNVIMFLILPPLMWMRGSSTPSQRSFQVLYLAEVCLNVFLRPLIDESAMLWTDGVPTYNRHDCSLLLTRAVVVWTINNFPSLGMLAGHRIKAFLTCSMCLDEVTSEHLGDMTCYQGHRRAPIEGRHNKIWW